MNFNLMYFAMNAVCNTDNDRNHMSLNLWWEITR